MMRKKDDVFDDVMHLDDEMDWWFDRMWAPRFGLRKKFPLLAGPKDKELVHWRKPLTDIMETDKELVSRFELPGLDKEDVKLNLSEDTLEIKAEKKAEKKEEKEGYYRHERSYSGFYRCMNLPQKIDPDKVETTFKDGVLEIRMPKINPGKSKVREIKIK